LVNNVGLAYEHVVHEHKSEEIESLIALNVFPVTLLTHHMIPKMRGLAERTDRKGLIINLSSIAADI
jgi:short-subunit dehydrogenase